MNKFFNWIHQQASMKDNRGGDGTRAAKGAYDSLIFFSANWGFQFHVKDCLSTLPSLNTRTNSRKPAKSARPFSIGMVALISLFVTDKTADPVLRHIGCCILLMCYTGIRFVQMQNFTLYGERDGVVYGQVFRKNPEHNRREDPAPFWIVLCDLNGDGKAPFFDVWTESVKDLLAISEEDKQPLQFAARSIRFHRGRAAEMLNGPMSYSQFHGHMWKVLVAACPGMTEDLARTFNPHSGRTFIQNVFKGRKESKQARMFTGEWAGYATNTQASECLWAPDQLRAAAVHRLMKMPDRYAKAQLAIAVVEAFDRNLKALRAFVAKQGGALATFQQEKFALDCQGDALHFGGPERATRIPGAEYEDE
jgi:hypothetical protein